MLFGLDELPYKYSIVIVTIIKMIVRVVFCYLSRWADLAVFAMVNIRAYRQYDWLPKTLT
jgi:hypothetical protein